jgi:putative transposase
MPRRTRMFIPDIPVHIVQRGHNRDPCFLADQDFLYYKEALGEGLNRYKGSLHAYCLMTNHVHLLITPQDKDSIPRIIQHVARQYTLHFNRSYRRSGALWEGRYKASLVNTEDYLLCCYKYIELNPVSAGMVTTPGEYQWSSYRSNALSAFDKLISAHPIYLDLGNSEQKRKECYQNLFTLDIRESDKALIRRALNKNYPTGDDRFKQKVEAILNRNIGTGNMGRPTQKY